MLISSCADWFSERVYSRLCEQDCDSVLSGGSRERGNSREKHLCAFVGIQAVIAIVSVNLRDDNEAGVVGTQIRKRPEQVQMLERSESSRNVDSVEDPIRRSKLGQRPSLSVGSRINPDSVISRKEEMIDSKRVDDSIDCTRILKACYAWVERWQMD
jgi:hypothetical protein